MRKDREQALGGTEESIAPQAGAKVGRRRHFFTPDSLVTEAYAVSDYLDLEQVGREDAILARELDEAREAFVGFPHHYPSREVFSRWKTSLERRHEALNLLVSLDDEIQEAANGRPITMSEFYLNHALQAGASFLLRGTLQRQRALTEEFGAAGKFRDLERLMRFGFLRDLSIRIGGLSLLDLGDKKCPISPASYFSFVAQTLVTQLKQEHKVIAKDNREYLSEYPNLVLNAVEVAATKVKALIGIQPVELDREIVRGREVRQQAAQRAKSVRGRMEKLREVVYMTVGDPTSQEFIALKEVVEHYLGQEREVRILAIHAVATQVSELYNLYQRARSLGQRGTEPSFFNSLAQAVREYVEEVPSVEDFFTSDDALTIFDPGISIVEDTLPPVEELGRIALSIRSLSSTKEYAIDPAKLSWTNLVSPQAVRLRFNPNNPRLFDIEFLYENDVGESLKFTLSFDVTKDQILWPFLEQPSESTEMHQLYLALISATHASLLEIKRQVQDDYLRKSAVTGVEGRGVVIKSKKVKLPRQYEKREKVERWKRQAPQTPIQVALSEPLSLQEARRTRNSINLPAEGEFVKKLEYISEVDRPIVKRGIAEYNERAVGRFQRKKLLGPDGMPRYTLAIGTTVPSGVRVLLREVASSTNGVRNFGIIDIRYRKDVYRKHSL